MRKGASSSRTRSQNDVEIKLIIEDIKKLLERIEDAVPLMNLAITTSGASLSTTLPSTVSPSRLLQASTFLTAADTQYSISPLQAVQVGPTFTLSMYMLFAGHVRPQDEEGIRETTWKEIIHKAKVKLRRVPMDLAFGPEEGAISRSQVPAEARIDEFAYQILIIEDLDDGRVHTFEEDEPQPGPFDGVENAGIREILPIHQISKIFYADTGKILNISTEGETNSPVLLLKRDINAIPPRRMLERTETEYEEAGEEEATSHPEHDEVQALLDAQLNGVAEGPERLTYPSFHENSIPENWRLPPGLDPEWIAFEVYNEEEDSETESEAEETSSPRRASRSTSLDPQLISKLSLDPKKPSHSPSASSSSHHQVSMSSTYAGTTTVTNPLFNNIRTSLSLLETLLRLTSLQQFQQQSHLSITDELLNFFLEESSTTGAGGDEQHRQRVRAEARRKVGWDPYDESPLKHRGEDYQYGWAPGGNSSPGHYPRDSDGFPLSPTYESSGYHIRSRESTPDSPLPPRSSPRPPIPERRRPTNLRNTHMSTNDSIRRGSPLSRPPAAPQKDEGLGTSPGSPLAKNDRHATSET